MKFTDGPVEEDTSSVCDRSAVGRNREQSGIIFEPSDVSKGNIARALFYFSVRYQIKIDPLQENHLRRWHQLDPVNQAERDRNEAIYKILYTRNPFIDHPELSAQIQNF